MKNRIEAVDLLRGFTIVAMILVNTPGDWSHVYQPLLHAEWNGLTPTDLIFPFFLFIVGISIYFSYKNKPNTVPTYRKITIRSLKLISLGLFLNLFVPYLPFITDLSTFRIPGVLQRIGIVFLISSILYLNCKPRTLLFISIAILISYSIFLGWIPFPNGTLSSLDRTPNNWANYIDLKVFGQHMWQADYDPEGLLSTLPSIVSCVTGILIGKLLDGPTPLRYLTRAIVILLATGYLLSIWIPINKALWSSSFVLVTCGWGTLILTIIYYITDVRKLSFGAIFKQVGMNAIVIYFLSSLISKSFYLIPIGESHSAHSWLYHKLFTFPIISQELSSLLYALTVVMFYMVLAHILYTRKVFIKV